MLAARGCAPPHHQQVVTHGAYFENMTLLPECQHLS
jgi:hypothetical protein